MTRQYISFLDRGQSVYWHCHGVMYTEQCVDVLSQASLKSALTGPVINPWTKIRAEFGGGGNLSRKVQFLEKEGDASVILIRLLL